MIAVGWQFEVKPEYQEAFEHFFGADGEWTTFSRRSRAFLGSSFLKDLAQPSAVSAGRVLERDARLREASRRLQRRGQIPRVAARAIPHRGAPARHLQRPRRAGSFRTDLVAADWPHVSGNVKPHESPRSHRE